MNVIDILLKLGYDIKSFSDGVYTVCHSANAIRDMAEGEYDYDIHSDFKLAVAEVEFNGLGNLCVTFKRVGHDNECWDVYEYMNMEKEY